MTTAHDFRLPSIDGTELDLSHWKGQPLLLVNTASRCGFTQQYTALQQLWARFGPQGLVVLGIPSDDFGHQEPGDTQDIWNFCHIHHGVTFPLAAKSIVRGPKAIPLFQWLAQEGGVLARPRWNFYKYLINRHGHLEQWFTPLTTPQSPRLVRTIKHLIQHTLT